jgi:alpha-soluble NSF attachment protein
MAQGDQFMKKAEGKATAIFFKDYDGAYENYIKAAGCYKADKDFGSAAEAFMRAGDMATKLKNPGDSCSAYTEAAKAFSKAGNLTSANQMMRAAIDLNIENNRLGAAARLTKDWAETVEADGKPLEAVVHYKKAADYFMAEDQKQSAVQCKVKIATILAQNDQFSDAAGMFETIGAAYADGPVKTMAKNHYFTAFLCRAAAVRPENRIEDAAVLREALESYENVDPYLPNTREHDVCMLLVQANEEEDESKVDEAVRLMESLRMLDDVKTHILLLIKERFSSAL